MTCSETSRLMSFSRRAAATDRAGIAPAVAGVDDDEVAGEVCGHVERADFETTGIVGRWNFDRLEGRRHFKGFESNDQQVFTKLAHFKVDVSLGADQDDGAIALLPLPDPQKVGAGTTRNLADGGRKASVWNVNAIVGSFPRPSPAFRNRSRHRLE